MVWEKKGPEHLANHDEDFELSEGEQVEEDDESDEDWDDEDWDEEDEDWGDDYEEDE